MDDYQPRAQLWKLFFAGKINCGDSEKTEEFSKKYVVHFTVKFPTFFNLVTIHKIKLIKRNFTFYCYSYHVKCLLAIFIKIY